LAGIAGFFAKLYTFCIGLVLAAVYIHMYVFINKLAFLLLFFTSSSQSIMSEYRIL